MSPILLVMILAAGLIVLAGVAFVRSIRPREGGEPEEPLSADSKVLLKPFDAALKDFEALSGDGSNASLLAAEGQRAVTEARREAYRLVLRRQKLVRDRGRAGFAGDSYGDTIARIDTVLAKLSETVEETRREVHSTSAKEGETPDVENAVGELRAVLLTARELRGDSEGQVRA